MGRIPRQAEEKWIRLFHQVLGGAAPSRGHWFEFLRGDPTPKRPKGATLPVDAYFPDFNLVVEYMGEQHSAPNPLMDRRPGRREQRRRYQERRTGVLREHGINLIRVRYDDELSEETVKAKLREVGLVDKDAKVIWKAP